MSEVNLSKRALSLEPSLTLQISAKAKKLSEEGKDICNLSAGEPDFDAPKEILNATSQAIFDGHTKYGPAAGDKELRKAIAKKLQIQNNLNVEFENVMVTNGAKQAIYNLFQVLLNDGDEVIIPAPYWLSYPQMVRLAGGKPIFLNSAPEDGFKINIQDLRSKISSKTKFIIINSPNNPTGRIMAKEELLQIAEVVREHKNINVLSDEIYELILKKEFRHLSLASLATDLKERIFIINGFAKGWAMTGWRVGYLVGKKEVIKASSALQSQSTSNVCSFVQRGALEALKINQEFFLKINSHYDLRREILYEGLRNIEGLVVHQPNGAFYAFPRLPNKSISSVDFCKKILNDYGLVIVPGKPFGDNQSFRISCATSKEKIIDGLSRLKKAVHNYYF
ncbi:Aminotransferases class-I [Prochlorococcus marinus str. MIT 9515]|uniref:Aminotransferase n=1 Tax=Prochlorococcus marinus (strain MIT 9515) TaxID=167542 RepID=A2BVZ5_PROM5|nr:pyridoxal phosphate-dependent aminotransferase [Prochlorococcus marinus]ABM71956.1 Aminotransferases class-I [Prochlorococcus marinus str. MIT 9515]